MYIKKTLLYEERDEKKRAEFLKEIAEYNSEDIVYVDESGIDQNLVKDSCWTFKGNNVIGNKSSGRRQRISIISGLIKNKFIAPFRFFGHTDTILFIHWLEKVLLPELIPGKVVVIDNASFHKSHKVRDLIEKNGCKLIYLPPYSPDLNPIEHHWADLKKLFKKVHHEFDEFLDAIDFSITQKSGTYLS